MDDDQTDPECVLLLLMERAFRGPAYANAQTRDWRTHMARVLQCVRENDPMLESLHAAYGRMSEVIKKGGPTYVGSYMREQALENRVKELEAAVMRAEAEHAAARAAKDGAYLERNQCVALIARMAIALGYWAGTAKTAIEGRSEDWHGCVYIDLPAGQVSWHYHDSQAHLFDWLPPYCGEWDGHDTPEKYERVLNRALMPNAYGVREQRRAEKAEAEVERLRHDIERHMAALTEFDNEVEQLRAERAALRADAERYRWLCDNRLHSVMPPQR